MESALAVPFTLLECPNLKLRKPLFLQTPSPMIVLTAIIAFYFLISAVAKSQKPLPWLSLPPVALVAAPAATGILTYPEDLNPFGDCSDKPEETGVVLQPPCWLPPPTLAAATPSGSVSLPGSQSSLTKHLHHRQQLLPGWDWPVSPRGASLSQASFSKLQLGWTGLVLIVLSAKG